MYFSKNTDSFNINLYLILLNKYLNEGQQDYKDLFEEIITDAHRLAVKEIDHYQVKSNIYDIVNLFVERNSDYFVKVDPQKIDNNVFVTLKNFMTSMASGQSLQTT